MIGIHYDDYEKYGCPHCGCDYAYSNSRLGGFIPAGCGECGKRFLIMPNDAKISEIGFSDGEGGFDYPGVVKHPREGISKHKFHAPDIRPADGGEYWKPRGIGYDLSGFVKSKEAGERILNMFRKALGCENIKTWLDYREQEPLWIQLKVQKEEVDLDKLYSLTKDTGVITQEIVNSVVIT